MRLGFVGTGTITAHLVRGLKSSALQDWPILLSPRNAGVAGRLAADLPGVVVADSNQAVLDGADVVVLAVRPQVAEAVIAPLRFRHDVPVISLIATLPIARLQDWTGAQQICRAIPLPFVERRADVTPVFPPLPVAVQIFDALGSAVAVADAAALDAYAAASAVMGSYFGLIETVAGWMQDQGIDAADATRYLRSLYGNLGDTLRQDPHPPAQLRAAHSTKGGLNEQLHAAFQMNGGSAALQAALTAVLARITGVKP